jgi:hypothetical protein
MLLGNIEEKRNKNGAGDGNRKQRQARLVLVSGLPPDICRIFKFNYAIA